MHAYGIWNNFGIYNISGWNFGLSLLSMMILNNDIHKCMWALMFTWRGTNSGTTVLQWHFSPWRASVSSTLASRGLRSMLVLWLEPLTGERLYDMQWLDVRVTSRDWLVYMEIWDKGVRRMVIAVMSWEVLMEVPRIVFIFLYDLLILYYNFKILYLPSCFIDRNFWNVTLRPNYLWTSDFMVIFIDLELPRVLYPPSFLAHPTLYFPPTVR